MNDAYRRYFDAMPCYLTVQDRDFRLVDANGRFKDDFGDITDRYCYQVYKNRSERCEVCPVAQAFRDGRCHRSEERVTRLDGQEIRVLVEASPIRDAHGDITSVMEMSTDITEIKDLERQLRRSQQRYRLLFDEVPCYISIQDPDLNIIRCNRAFQDDFGSCLGRKCYEAYKHRTEPCVPCPVQDVLQDGEIHSTEELVTSLDGKHQNVLVTAAPIRDRRGRISGVMEMSANITQVRELESRLTSLGLLIGSVSHSLKGLLNGLAGGMYLVNTGLKKNDEQRMLKGWSTVQRNVGRIQSMVSDILYYAKDRVPNWEPLSAADVGRDVCGLAEARAREYGVALRMDIAPDAGAFEADAQAVRSLLVNLLENSLDACRLDDRTDDHEVTLRVRGDGEYVAFEIADDGIGMDRETQDKAFTLFFSSKGTGTGLGLFIADRITRAHGGTIELESEPGVGTQFVVRLLRTRPEGETAHESRCQDDPGGGR